MHWGTLEIKKFRKEFRDFSVCPNRPLSQHYLYNGESGNQEVTNWGVGKSKMERKSNFSSSRMQLKFGWTLLNNF